MTVNAPRSLGRVLHLFDEIARANEGLSLTEASVLLDSPKSSLLNILRPLVAQDYLTQDDTRYRLGPAAYRLASTILSGRRLSVVYRPFLEELGRASKETVFLATLDREARLITYVDCVESPQVVRYVVPVGSTRPIYATSAGRVLLAFADDDWRENYIKSEKFKRLTASTPIGKDVLRKRLNKIYREGLEVSLGDAVEDVGGLSAAIKNSDGSVDAALLIGAPVERLERNLPHLKRLILDVADKASGS